MTISSVSSANALTQLYEGLSSDTKPTVGVQTFALFKETDTGSVFEYSGSSWVRTVTDGSTHVRPYGEAATISKRMLTINADTDCFTDASAPIAAELLTATFAGTQQHLRVSYHTELGAIPFASAVVVTVNEANDNDAIASLTWDDKGAGDTSSTDEGMRMISSVEPVIEYDFSGTSTYITRVDCGGYLAAGTGAGTVYIMLEVW